MQRIPPSVCFGTSSWTFPGWGGLVYPGSPSERELADWGLEHYAAHPLFRTVGIDRSYYKPLEEATLRHYAEQLPSQFRCVSKVWSGISARVDARSRAPNPLFLSRAAFENEVLAPLHNSFRDHQGPLVLELLPLKRDEVPDHRRFADELDAFFSGLPQGLQLAVELRNYDLLTPSYTQVLERHGVGHVFNYWERMPSLRRQLACDGLIDTAPFVVCRLLIPPGRRYAARKLELAPFDRLVDPQPEMRADVALIARACQRLGKTLFVLVNNKAEGSSPLTVRALAQQLALELEGK